MHVRRPARPSARDRDLCALRHARARVPPRSGTEHRC